MKGRSLEMRLNYIDCCDNILGLQAMPDNCVDLTVTSPPYDNLRAYKGFAWDEEGLIKELYRVTKPGGAVVWIVGDATVNGSETGSSFRQALYFKSVGFNLLDTMIYEKSGCGACGSNKCYIQNFEYMFVFSKGPIKTFNLLYDRENKEVGKQRVNGQRDKHTADTGRLYREIETKKMGRRFNIWRYNQTSGHDAFSKKHPAPFPEQLARDHIISWSNPGDVVLDPFMGSGTTAKMAVLTGRHYIGFELSEEYHQLAQQRVNEAVDLLLEEVSRV